MAKATGEFFSCRSMSRLRYVSSALTSVLGEDVAEALGGGRLGTRQGERHHLLDFRLAGALDLFQFPLALPELVDEPPAKQLHRVAPAPLLELLPAAVAARVAARVALEAVR